MSQVPEGFKYTKSHEWVEVLGDGTVKVGISDHAQGMLGDMVYVELPEIGQQVTESEEVAVIESVKAASDIYSPVTGEVVEVNEVLNDTPELVNNDCYGEGWIMRIKLFDESEVDKLLDVDGYKEVIAAEEH